MALLGSKRQHSSIVSPRQCVLLLGARMKWRLLTAINAIIALVTVGAVIFDLTRSRSERSLNQRQPNSFQANSATNHHQREEPADKNRIESPDDFANARVDDLGAVAAVELTELMMRATPEQLAAMALKFNEAPTDARTFGGMGIFFQAWAQVDPSAALIGAFRINDVGMRKLAARTVVLSVSPSAAPELIAFMIEHPDKDLATECKSEFLGSLISNWSQVDPEAASRFIDEMADAKNDRGYGLAYGVGSEIAYNWATLDPSAALEWAAKQKAKNSDYAFDLYDSVIRGWCRRDVSTASAYVAQHLNDQESGTSASSVVAAMFDHNIDDATSWVHSLPAGDPRDQAESRIASLWAAKDPSAAAKWVATLPAKEQTNAVSTIARNWVETNWPDASRWIATLTGDARDQALAVAVNRDGATPSDSLSLALSIGKEEVRNDVIENVIRTWAATDASAAETWVKGSPLSSEQRDQLRSVIAETQKAADGERVIVH
jgi:Tfp pilus assembly major pilin PilA